MGANGVRLSIDETLSIDRQAQRIIQRGVQLAIVVGGGNILRGAQFSAGGEVIRAAILRKEEAEEGGRKAGALTRAIAGIPERIGIHVGR